MRTKVLWYEDIPERELTPPEEDSYPICPFCWNEAHVLYKNANGAVLGCDECFPEDGEYDEAEELRGISW